MHATQPSKSYGAEFAHLVGDDYRGWSTQYGVEGRATTDPSRPLPPPAAQTSEEQFGSMYCDRVSNTNFHHGFCCVRVCIIGCGGCTVLGFEHNFALEFHAFAPLEALPCV
jgi:hypothetical protein